MKHSYQKTTLANGLRVLTCPMPHTYSVGVGFYISAGSRYEQPPIAGAAHFVEHMLFKGTAQRPSAEALAQEIEGHGGVFNASTSQETTVLWAKMLQTHLPLALDVLADMLRYSTLAPEEIEKERRVILEELSSSQDIPEELVGLVLHGLTWPDHPLGWDVAGTPVSVAGLSREDLLHFLATYYTPQHVVISVAGDVQHEQVVEQAARILGDWRVSNGAPHFAPAPSVAVASPRVAVVRKKVEQSHLALHLPGLQRNDPDRFALSLLNVVLGEGMSSRLFLEIRERLGLAYAVDSYNSYLSDTGVTGIYAAVAPDRAAEALAAILGQVRRLREEPLEETSLTAAKEFIKGRMLLGMEETLAVSSWFGRQEVMDSEQLTVEDIVAHIEAVRAEDMLAVAQRLWQPSRGQLAVVGPHKQAEAARFRALMAAG